MHRTMQGTDPLLIALATALRLAHPADTQLGRALDKIAQQPEIAFEFDGVELRVISFDPNQAMYYVTDGVDCTCPGARHRWCKHRALHRLLLAAAALRDPGDLSAQIVAHVAPQPAAPAVGALPDDVADWCLDDTVVYAVTTYTRVEITA